MKSLKKSDFFYFASLLMFVSCDNYSVYPLQRSGVTGPSSKSKERLVSECGTLSRTITIKQTDELLQRVTLMLMDHRKNSIDLLSVKRKKHK